VKLADYGGAMQRVQTSDGSLVIGEVFGDTQAWTASMPLVLLHGLSQQRHFWGPVISRMPGVPIIALDLRGHGDADVDPESDFSVVRCASDVWELLDSMGIERAVIAGHSWGASVALAAAAHAPERTASLVLVDGALVVPAHLGPRDDIRTLLTPPVIDVNEFTDITAMLRHNFPEWNPEIAAALTPTFAQTQGGTWTTRLGFTRHMAVLDAFLDYDSTLHWPHIACPTWLITCASHGLWESARRKALAELPQRDNIFIQHWGGAIHDVPLQWPSLVAGLFDTAWQRGMRS
jgi:pimeloyl-ACP methyl ester carboxylesterase